VSAVASAAAEAVCARIETQLRALRLPGALARYRELAAELGCDAQALRLLDGVLAAEIDSRELHRYQNNLRAARFPVVKELGGFDFTAMPSLDRARVDELATGRFIRAHEAVILIGNPGTGKTHVLIGLGMAAIRAGYRVRFVTTAALVNELLLARAELRVPKLLRQYAAFDLVLVDLCRPSNYADDRGCQRATALVGSDSWTEELKNQSA
jgi:DNA replication protein DnaC